MNGTTKHKDGNGPQQTDLRHFDLRRLIALVTKESYQALRDPSTLLIAFVLPVVLLPVSYTHLTLPTNREV